MSGIGRACVVAGLLLAGCLVLAGSAFAQAPAAEVTAGTVGLQLER